MYVQVQRGCVYLSKRIIHAAADDDDGARLRVRAPVDFLRATDLHMGGYIIMIIIL